MSETNNIVIEQLRLIRNEIVAFRDEVRDRLTRLELRVGIIEQRLSGIEARLADAETVQQKRLDRIEKRLELTD